MSGILCVVPLLNLCQSHPRCQSARPRRNAGGDVINKLRYQKIARKSTSSGFANAARIASVGWDLSTSISHYPVTLELLPTVPTRGDHGVGWQRPRTPQRVESHHQKHPSTDGTVLKDHRSRKHECFFSTSRKGAAQDKLGYFLHRLCLCVFQAREAIVRFYVTWSNHATRFGVSTNALMWLALQFVAAIFNHELKTPQPNLKP